MHEGAFSHPHEITALPQVLGAFSTWGATLVTAGRTLTHTLMKKLIPVISLILLTGCAAPPPVRIASSILGRTVGKKLKDQYQQNHPAPSPTPAPTPASLPAQQ